METAQIIDMTKIQGVYQYLPADNDIFQPEHDLLKKYKSGQNEIRDNLDRLFGREGYTKEQDNNINEANQLLTVTTSYRELMEEPDEFIRKDIRQRLAHLMLGLDHLLRRDR